MSIDAIDTLLIDFEKGILEVNGEIVEEPIIVSLPDNIVEGWGKSKLFNDEKLASDKGETPAIELKVSLEKRNS